MKDVFRPHSDKQELAITTKKPILVLGTGTQYGKTTVGALRMKEKLFTYTKKDDAFIITAPSFNKLHQSTLPAFLKIMEGWGNYNKKHEVFEMHKGGKVYCRTETDMDSIIGITNVRHIWGDEAGKYRKYFWENMQARAEFHGCGIDLTTSPYALNWIYKELIKPASRGLRDDVELIQAASWDNPYHSLHDPKRRQEKKNRMDPRRFNMIFGGEWGKMEGLVYDCWVDSANLIKPFRLPIGTKYYGGIDWGYNPDPFALKIRAITPDGRHYGVSEYVKTRMTITDIVELCIQKKQIYEPVRWYCDPSQPGYIEELNRNGIVAVKAKNDIRVGLDLHYELIRSRKYKEFVGSCPHSADERETYHYPELKDLGPDQDSKEVLPVDQNNHCMDIDRYLTIALSGRENKKEPKVPNGVRSKNRSHLKRLQTSYKQNHGSENYS